MAFAHLLPKLFLLLFAAWGLGRLALRLGFPMLLGEILAGVLLGPPFSEWFPTPLPGPLRGLAFGHLCPESKPPLT